ncbi:MAG TPA: DUF3298 domain-containing protein [Aliidongia sp.]|uniref:DUF3298 domain-containing protein n=1 Tax=Aliidongia sp. TaxID=1914230 RepID=UPI002DDD05A1|nr:DUF3298 domain-containing protein [Aliidongia sp.]HEV2677602.1 DUF3298 domain-containing protein [Aliidongia sp.]
MRIAILLAGLALAGFSPHAVLAASIDCAKAKYPYDKAICADPELRQLDVDLAAAYDKLAAIAGETGRDRIRRGEYDRHTYTEELCASSDKACLAAAYRQGLSSVARFAEQPAGAALVPVERFRLTLVGRNGPKTSVASAFPRIDHPAVPWAGQFEKAARRTAEALLPEDPATDAVVDYRSTYLAPDLAAVAFLVQTFPHGAAHGTGRLVAFAYLPGEQRGLRPTDLFQSGTTWSGFLAESALAGLQQQATAGGWALTVSSPGELETTVADPDTWVIHPNGLGLAFDEGSVAARVAGAHEVLIPWADLKPYLSATPAFAIPQP